MKDIDQGVTGKGLEIQKKKYDHNANIEGMKVQVSGTAFERRSGMADRERAELAGMN